MSIHLVAIHTSAVENRLNVTKNPYVWNSKSFKVIDVDSTKKFVTSACYKQHDSAYLQALSR